MSQKLQGHSKSTDTQIYADFMGEIKTRMKAVHGILSALRPSQNPSPEAFVNAESAILQIRFICELIALSSLCVHGDFGLSLTLMKSYHAGNIFRDLERLNQHSFPKAIKPFRWEEKINLIIKEEALDREGLEAIYNGCGSLLHRGVLKNVLKGHIRDYDMSLVNRWAKQIQDLLTHHTIAFMEHGKILVVSMNSPQDGSVQVVTLKAVNSPTASTR